MVTASLVSVSVFELPLLNDISHIFLLFQFFSTLPEVLMNACADNKFSLRRLDLDELRNKLNCDLPSELNDITLEICCN